MNDLSSTAHITVPAAHIAVPRKVRSVPSFRDSIAQLLAACGPDANLNDRCIVAILACLDAGISSRKGIIDALKPHGFNYQHIAILLKAGTGDKWQRDEKGVYVAMV